MKIDVTFRNMESTEGLQDYVEKYTEKFKKYLAKYDPLATFVHVVLDGHLEHRRYTAEVRVKTPHFNLIVNRQNHDMYPLIDEIMHIMERDLQIAKEKEVDMVKKRKKISEIE
ncbi:ribosome-associated translation inhibitor RaiA [Candidatus Dependentiae bacterium]|nr:ribosome-associated translation inhibitor RaiA [Candidatus Dependentiae bacterium]